MHLIVFFASQVNQYHRRFCDAPGDLESTKSTLARMNDKIVFILQGDDMNDLDQEALRRAQELEIEIEGLKLSTDIPKGPT